MLERFAFVMVMALLIAALYRLYINWQLQAIGHSDPVLRDIVPGVPTIVYFTTPWCVPCKTQQQPALQHLKTEFGDNLQIVQIDATRQPDTADRWGVLSAPTTFVLNADGHPDAVNHGVADEQKLKKQLYAAMQIA